MSQPTILIVEDEQKLSRVLQLELEYENYITEIANNGEDALQLIREKEWDLVLLDIMLPGLSGIEVLRKIRRDRKSTRLNSSHVAISYAVFCLKKKTTHQ